MAAEKILLLSAIMLAWTYIFYPAIVFVMAAGRTKRNVQNNSKDRGQQTLPSVSVIMSLFNEEKVISEKIRSLLLSDYPSELTEFIIGSDASADDTDEIMMKFDASDSRIQYHRNSERKGKAAMLNELAAMAKGSILIITDANVIFSRRNSKAPGFRIRLVTDRVMRCHSRSVSISRKRNYKAGKPVQQI